MTAYADASSKVSDQQHRRRRTCGFETRCIVIVTTILLFLSPSPLHAQTTSLSIWPPILDTVIQPGKAITQVYRLKNLGDDTKITASIVPFEVDGELGQIKLSNTPSPFISYFSLQNADLSLPATTTLKAGETQEYVLKLKIPEDAQDADHYFTFLFSSDTKGLISDTGLRTLASIGSNILLTISSDGNPQKNLKIEEFSLNHLQNKPVIIDSFSTTNFTLRVKNTGQTKFKAIGQIEVKNTFGQPVAHLSLREDNILAGTIRELKLDQPWQPVFPFGHYQATAAITPYDSLDTITQTYSFYAFPYKMLLIILLFVGLYKFKSLTLLKK